MLHRPSRARAAPWLAPLVCVSLARCDCARPLPPDLPFHCETSADCARGSTCLGNLCRREGEATLAFATPPRSVLPGACSGELRVEVQAPGATPLAVAEPTPVALSATLAGLELHATPACDGPAVTGLTIPAGESGAAFHVRGAAAGEGTISASAGVLGTATQAVTISAVPPSALAFTSAPQTVRVNVCSGPAVVEVQDAAGNPVAVSAPLDIGLAATPAGSFEFYADGSCSTPVTQVTVASGQSSAVFHFRGTAPGGVQVTAQASGLASAQQTQTLTPVTNQLAFTSAPQTVDAGACSQVLTVQRQDPSGAALVIGSDTVVTLSAPPAAGMTFFAGGTCAAPGISAVTIPAGASSASVWFQATSPGGHTITASAAGFTGASQLETIVAAPPAALVFTTASQTLVAGACSGAVAVEARDAVGNPSGPAMDTPLTLTSSFTGGAVTFSTSPTCSPAATSVVMPAGVANATFYFRSTRSGSPQITAQAPWDSATQTEVIQPGPAAALAITSPPQTVRALGCSPTVSTVSLQDAFGNAVVAASPVTVNLSSPGLTFASDSACSTVVTSRTIAAGSGSANFRFTGKTGGTHTVTASSGALAPGTQDQVLLPVVRRGTCTMPAGSAFVNCPAISPAQTSLSDTFLVFQATVGTNATPGSSAVECWLNSTTRVQCDRVGTSQDATIHWQTVEIPSGVDVQDEFPGCNTTTQVFDTISTVAPANTFLLFQTYLGGQDWDDEDHATARLLVDGSTVVLESNAPCESATFNYGVQAVEMSGVTVVRGVETGITGLTRAVAGLPAADLSRTALFHTTRLGGSSVPPLMCDRGLRGTLSGSTSLSFSRGNGNTACSGMGVAVLDVAWERVDFGSRATVQRVDVSMPPGVLTTTATIGAVDPTRTVVLSGGMLAAGNGTGEGSAAVADIIGELTARHELLDATTVRLTRGSAAGSGRWDVTAIQFEQ
jgi:hypothetical protein